MKWVKMNDYYARSEPPGFTIARFGMGETFAFEAFRDKVAIHVERDIPKDDEDARRAAVKRCQAACEAAANE